jgi:hypothetical protein
MVLLNIPFSELVVHVYLLLTQVEDSEHSKAKPQDDEALGRCLRAYEEEWVLGSTRKSLQRLVIDQESLVDPSLVGCLIVGTGARESVEGKESVSKSTHLGESCLLLKLQHHLNF